MVAEDEHPVAERGLGGAGALDEAGVGRRGQVAGALDAALGVQVGARPEHQQSGERCDAVGRVQIVCRSSARSECHRPAVARGRIPDVHVIIAPDAHRHPHRLPGRGRDGRGLGRTAPGDRSRLPLSDGGPGFVDVLAEHLDGECTPW